MKTMLLPFALIFGTWISAFPSLATSLAPLAHASNPYQLAYKVQVSENSTITGVLAVNEGQTGTFSNNGVVYKFSPQKFKNGFVKIQIQVQADPAQKAARGSIITQLNSPAELKETTDTGRTFKILITPSQ